MPFANNNGVKIHYEVEGQGTSLMLVHGRGGTMEAWRRNGYASELSKDHRLILVDVRGHGASDKPHEPAAYEPQIRVKDLSAVLDDLNITTTNYFGYSMGGSMGFDALIYAPERFRSMILGGAAYTNAETTNRGPTQIQQELTDAIREAPESPMKFFVATLEKRIGRLSAARKAEQLANDARALLALASLDINAIWRKPDEVLPRIKAPCLLFAGESDSAFLAAKECAGCIPGARFVPLPGLDHTQAFESRDLVLPIVKKFLAEVNS